MLLRLHAVDTCGNFMQTTYYHKATWSQDRTPCFFYVCSVITLLLFCGINTQTNICSTPTLPFTIIKLVVAIVCKFVTVI